MSGISVNNGRLERDQSVGIYPLAADPRSGEREERRSHRPLTGSQHQTLLERRRVDVMCWVLRMKREANQTRIDTVVAATGERLIFEISARDSWWRSQPTGNRYEGKNVPVRLCMEVCQQLRDDDQAARSDT